MSMSTVDKLLAIAYGYEKCLPFFAPHCGLCSNCGLHGEVEQYCCEWSEWSGNIGYPVPCDASPRGNIMGYYDVPLYCGEYGELRRDLARHLAHCLIRDRK